MLKLNSKEQNIWWTSDTHYWHKNITLGVSVWKDKEKNCRDFKTTQEMSHHIIDQINKYVGQNDILFHLGDWSFGGISNIWNFRSRIICKNIHLIYGNHDNHIINDRILPNCHYLYDGDTYGEIITNIDPQSILPETSYYVGAQDLFKSTQQYLEISIDKILVVLMHYPIQEWNDRFKRSYHLFGHVHGRIPHSNGRLDVGMDNAFKVLGEYKPFSWRDIKQLLGRPNNVEDNKIRKRT